MRILLLSCNTGEGHNAAAKAIMEVLEKKHITCVLQDALGCRSARVSKMVSNWHVRLYKYAPWLMDIGYRAFECCEATQEERSLVYELLRSNAGQVRAVLAAGAFDGVICTHVFAGMIMTEVRRVFRVNIPCFFVATDYTCCPMTEQCDLDGFFIPHPAVAEEYLQAGIPAAQLLPWGIPVRQAFYRAGNSKEARRQLGLPEEGVIVLLMCGSMGCGPIRKIARSLAEGLPPGAAVVAVCGKNKKLYESMIELNYSNLRVLGFCDRISLYMDAADILVTKPGGLSTTEAAVKGLPTVLFNTVGGCESRNFDFFLSRGWALGSEDGEETVKLALQLALLPELRTQLRRELRQNFGDNSAGRIVDHVLKAAEDYRQLQKQA